MPSGTNIKIDSTKSTGCMAHLLLKSARIPTTTAITAVIIHTCAVATCSKAIDIICRFSTCTKGVPETSDMTKGASSKAIKATLKAAKAPVRLAMNPSTVNRASCNLELSLSGISGLRKNAVVKNEPMDSAIKIQAIPRKNGKPNVVSLPGSGIPNAAKESARKNKEINPPTTPAMSAAPT